MMAGTFGLALPPFDAKSETVSARKTRITKVEASILLLFKLARFHLGEKKARKLFVSAAKVKEGKRGNAKVNSELLRKYDARVAGHPSRVSGAPRLVAEELHKNHIKEFGSSPEAIEKRIRRALTARKTKDEDALRLAEMFHAGNGIGAQLSELYIGHLKKRLALYPREKKRSATNHTKLSTKRM